MVITMVIAVVIAMVIAKDKPERGCWQPTC